MSAKPTNALDRVHPQMLSMQGEGDRKKVAIGESIERALKIAGISQQEAAYQMGYTDQGTVSRWCQEKERPHFDKLFQLDGFEEAWMEVHADRHPRMRRRTVIEIDERRRA